MNMLLYFCDSEKKPSIFRHQQFVLPILDVFPVLTFDFFDPDRLQ